MNPKYPIYIISKGRWELRHTSKALEKMKVPYKIVIEPQEYEQYSKVIDKNKILVLPFSNLGQGSIPARNWVWEDSIKKGFKRHWILDDNIRSFYRVNKSERYTVKDGTTFRCCEDFTERYKNIGLSGMQYEMFGVPGIETSNLKKPFLLNTRIYSCILIKNNLEFRWRGKYNEDTDLSLRVLKAGYCTVLFIAFLCKKIESMLLKGGNTDELYKGDGRYQMALSLKRQHPELVKITWKWKRWQHSVNYKPFKNNKLIKKENIKIKKGINNYNMILKGKENVRS